MNTEHFSLECSRARKRNRSSSRSSGRGGLSGNESDLNLNLSQNSEVVHPGGDVDGVAPDVVERLLSADDAGDDAADVDALNVMDVVIRWISFRDCSVT